MPRGRGFGTAQQLKCKPTCGAPSGDMYRGPCQVVTSGPSPRAHDATNAPKELGNFPGWPNTWPTSLSAPWLAASSVATEHMFVSCMIT